MAKASFKDEKKKVVSVTTDAWFLNIDAASMAADSLIRKELGTAFCRGKWSVVSDNHFEYEVDEIKA